MAVPNSTSYTISGQLPGGERWASTWWGAPLAAGVTAQARAASLVADPLFTGFRDQIKAFFNAGTNLNALTVRKYGADGKLSDSGTVTVASGGGSGTPALPNQTAIVASLRSTDNTRSGRGRMYLPLTSGLVSPSTGTIPTADALSIAQKTADLMAATAGAVASETRGSLITVSRVGVGTVPDTQRRRREGLVENYQFDNV